MSTIFSEKKEPGNSHRITKAELEMLRGNRKSRFNIENSALIVLDMQRFFLDRDSHAFIPGAVEIIPGLNSLIKGFRKKNQPVILTRHLNTDENAGAMARWWNDLIREESSLSELAPELDTLGIKPIRKSQYDAFLDTWLQNLLEEKDVSQVVIGGVMTHLCCETTARSAFTRGFDVFFLADGTASYTTEHNKATLLNISHGFGFPVLVNEVLLWLND